jgi:hypothetical protein
MRRESACAPRRFSLRRCSTIDRDDATLNQYKAGTVPYTSVITEQELLLTDQQTLLSVQQSRLVASVALIEALGGGWSAKDLPVKIKTPNPLVP